MKKTKDEFRELIEHSGHNFHLEVVSLLRKNHWEVEISPYYYDDSAEKPREIDIIATKPVSIFKDAAPSYNIFLFIECKHLDGEVVFWMDDINKDKAKRVVLNSIKGLNINKGDTIKENHYLEVPDIAKLFETKQKEKKSNQDIIFSAFTQGIKSLIFYKDYYGRSGIYYPIVVYEPKEKVAIYSEKDPKKYETISKRREIILEVNYSFKRGIDKFISREDFFIDFIAKNDLEAFLNVKLVQEAEEINNILRLKLKKGI